jgi:hypothetical protein
MMYRPSQRIQVEPLFKLKRCHIFAVGGPFPFKRLKACCTGGWPPVMTPVQMTKKHCLMARLLPNYFKVLSRGHRVALGVTGRRLSQKIRVNDQKPRNECVASFRPLGTNGFLCGLDERKRISAIQDTRDKLEARLDAEVLLNECYVALLALPFAAYEDALALPDLMVSLHPIVGTAP